MGVLTDTGTIPPVVAQYYDRKLLRRALPRLVHLRVAQRRPLAMRNGNTMMFRRLEALALATAALVEGVPPTGKALSKTDISATIQQFGDYVTLTDLVQATVEHPLLQDANRLLGEQSAQTLDVLARDVWVAGTNVLFGGAAASRAALTTTTHKIDTTVLDRAVRFLNQQNASRFTEMISASVKINTFPIRPAFWAITHPDILFTLQTLAGWIPVEQYAAMGPVLEAEVGAYKDVRFLTSTNAKVYLEGGGALVGDVQGVTNADVYVTLIMGMDAVGAVPLDGMSLQNIIKPIGSGGPADPLNQIGTSGWKHTGTRVRLNEFFMTRIETTAGKVNP